MTPQEPRNSGSRAAVADLPSAASSPEETHPDPAPPRVKPVDRDRMRRVTRLLKILSLLRSGRRYGLAALARECGCSTKTIQRDLSYWREMDIPVDYDADEKTYVLYGDLPFRLLELGVGEVTSLALAEVAMEAAQGRSLKDSIASAFQKIHNLVPEDVAERLEGCRDALVADGAKRDYSHAPLTELVSACWHRLTVMVDYESHSSGRRTRPIEPYRIAFLDGFWIVIARDPERREVRNFALDRIRKCSFPRPDIRFDIPPDWSITRYLAGSVSVLRGEETDIALRFEKESVPWLAGRKWRFPHTVSDPAEDGSVTLTGTVLGLDEIAREVLRWGRHVTVLEPQALRERVAGEARAIAAKYGA